MFRSKQIQELDQNPTRKQNPLLRKLRISIAFLIFIAVYPVIGFSQDSSATGMNLNRFIQAAFRNNTDLKIIASELQMGQLESQEKAADLKPQIKAYGKYHWYWAEQPELIFPEDAGTILSNGTSEGSYPLQMGLPNNLALGMNVEQRVYDQRFFLSKQSHELFNSLSENRLKIGKDDLAYEIARQYFELNELQSRKKTLEFNKRRLLKAIKILQIQVRNDMVPETDLEKTELRLQKLEAGEVRLKNGIRQKEEYIRLMAGLQSNDVLAIQPSMSDTIPLLLLQGNDSTYKTPAFALLEDMKQSNLLKLEYLKADHLPALDFFADVNWVSQTENLAFFKSGAMNNQSFLGLKLNIPIYSGDQFNKQKQKAGIQNDIYRLQQSKIEEGQQLQINRFKQELESLDSEWKIQQQLENIALRQLNQAESKFEKGVININEFFTAEEEWLNAGKEKNELLLKIKMAEIDFLKASGQIEILYK